MFCCLTKERLLLRLDLQKLPAFVKRAISVSSNLSLLRAPIKSYYPIFGTVRRSVAQPEMGTCHDGMEIPVVSACKEQTHNSGISSQQTPRITPPCRGRQTSGCSGLHPCFTQGNDFIQISGLLPLCGPSSIKGLTNIPLLVQ